MKYNLITKVKNDKLNIGTATCAIVFLVIYTIGLIVLITIKTSLSKILSLSADYVTVVSCILVLIQLVAFVKDSRRNEFRARKEAAYKIAREYANDILSNMAFIQVVIAVCYNKSNPIEMENIAQTAKIDSFLYKKAQTNSSYKKYIKCLVEEDDAFSYDTIMNYSIVYRIPTFLDIRCLDNEDIKKHLSNNRFSSLIYDTLNTLECFAMSVNQNVADSEMLYASLHQTFLKFVRYVYPFICIENIEEENFYPNIIILYKSWNIKESQEKNRKEELENKKQKLIDKNKIVGRPL